MSYTDKEAEEWERKFKEADVDNDGKISLKELENLMVACGMKYPNKFKLKFMLNVLDTDNDKHIDFEEFLKLSDVMSLRSKLLKIFKSNLSEGRYLHREDVRKVLKSLFTTVSDQDIEGVLSEADTNQDGRIDHNEFIEYFVGKLER